ncbi:hypothetical protein KXW98_001969 [Aspergillus fumigatus]|uniref:Uncharacterized protein n=3 Tax=Aspergillus fumigatus TaxID=746128 RepID=E9R733_ASPFU|nr:conserved hypothetical protein [Aspergillus fumigatus Af293]EDP56359.1 conserved hypothetical protein [Aspergillus fumigatus A1163]KAF4264370.1 hypothetical protein CNMCM8714_007553 [Aspergillus fumigatus]KMK60998.1 hypothetical protein Y699_08148 [Aspergillus fumigatus Z5]EAL90453.1 conserved hypothetical protein [Aspergillus fumigatus Af293]KAF4266427.1 hypothetical protein CNMCM8057_000216 [Aspergillus fumigatus]
MVKIALLNLTLLAALAPLAAARNCKDGLNYCGWNLLNIGKYGAQVNGALTAAHQPTDDAHIRESLFHCNGGADGDISFIKYCGGGCKNGGNDRSDYC